MASQSSFCRRCRPQNGWGAQQEVGCCRRTGLGDLSGATLQSVEECFGDGQAALPPAGRRAPLPGETFSWSLPFPKVTFFLSTLPSLWSSVFLTCYLLCDKEILPLQQTDSLSRALSEWSRHFSALWGPHQSLWGEQLQAEPGVLDSPEVQTMHII